MYDVDVLQKQEKHKEATLAGAYRLPQHANGFFNLEIGQKSQILILNLKMLNFRFDSLAANK